MDSSLFLLINLRLYYLELEGKFYFLVFYSKHVNPGRQCSSLRLESMPLALSCTAFLDLVLFSPGPRSKLPRLKWRWLLLRTAHPIAVQSTSHVSLMAVSQPIQCSRKKSREMVRSINWPSWEILFQCTTQHTNVASFTTFCVMSAVSRMLLLWSCMRKVIFLLLLLHVLLLLITISTMF